MSRAPTIHEWTVKLLAGASAALLLAGCGLYRAAPPPVIIDASQRPPAAAQATAPSSAPPAQTNPSPTARYGAPPAGSSGGLNQPGYDAPGGYDAARPNAPGYRNPAPLAAYSTPTPDPGTAYSAPVAAAAAGPTQPRSPAGPAPVRETRPVAGPVVRDVRVTEVGVGPTRQTAPAEPTLASPAEAPLTGGGAADGPTIGLPTPQQPLGGTRQTNLLVPAVAEQPANPAGATDAAEAANALERFAAEHPDDPRAALALCYFYLARGQPEKARQVLPSQTEQANRTLENLRLVAEQVADRAELLVSTVKICSKVDGFARYEEAPPAELTTGKPQRAFVYCELENFKCRQDAQGKYLADLHADITLYDDKYAAVASLSADVPDVPSVRPRRDFFLRGLLNLPTLGPGRYQLTVQVEDKIAGKLSRPQHLFFEVKPDHAAPPIPAAP